MRAARAAISAAAWGWANWRAAAPICARRATVAQQRRYLLRQAVAVSSACGSSRAALAVGQRLGIVALMIVRRRRQRNENCRLPCGRDFRDGAGSGAAKQQIGARERSRHIVDERRNLSGDSVLRSTPLCASSIILLAGLMDEVNVREPPPPDCGSDSMTATIDGVRALAAAEDQQRRRSIRRPRRARRRTRAAPELR